ncbi:MAG: hypothetical protein ACPG5B_02265 [Chitinophagales bacterium]
MPKQSTADSFFIKKKGFGQPSSFIKNLQGQPIFGGDFRLLVSNKKYGTLQKDVKQFTDKHQAELKLMYDGHPRFRQYIGCTDHNYKAPYDNIVAESLAV